MSGFGNDNNNENQDLGALNMGFDSMFSNAPENVPNENVSMFSDAGQNLPQENISNPRPDGGLGAQPIKQAPTPPDMQHNLQKQAQGLPKPQTPVPPIPPKPQPPQQSAQQTSHKQETKEEFDDEVITVKPIRFASFENEVSAVGTPRKNLDIMQDVKAKITVELGRCKMKVKKVLDIQKGSIIEINKVAGEQVELFVCGKLVAHGEVIVIEDKFGLRITSIIEDKTL